MKKTITIGGGGLAGLSLGIVLRRAGVPVTLHEAGRYPRHRVCGEYISGVTDETLEALGILDLFDPALRQQSTSWYCGDRLLAEQPLPEPARGISRHYLDEALAGRFQDLGGELRTGSRLPHERGEGLVWSAGRRPEKGEWIGLKCHFRDCETASDLEMHLGNGAYVGLARVEGGAVNACGLFRLQSGLSGEGIFASYLEKAGLHRMGQRLGAAARVEGSLSAIAGFRLGWQESRDELVIGDAAAMIAPFTGNGMSMAFQSAEMAFPALVDYATGRSAWDDTVHRVRQRLRRKFRRRVSLASVLHPFLTTPRGQRVLSATFRRGALPFRLCYHLLR